MTSKNYSKFGRMRTSLLKSREQVVIENI